MPVEYHCNAHEHFATVFGRAHGDATIVANAHKHFATVFGSDHGNAIFTSGSNNASGTAQSEGDVVGPTIELIVTYNAMPCNSNPSPRLIVEYNFVQIPAFLFQERTSFREGEWMHSEQPSNYPEQSVPVVESKPPASIAAILVYEGDNNQSAISIAAKGNETLQSHPTVMAIIPKYFDVFKHFLVWEGEEIFESKPPTGCSESSDRPC